METEKWLQDELDKMRELLYVAIEELNRMIPEFSMRHGGWDTLRLRDIIRSRGESHPGYKYFKDDFEKRRRGFSKG